jgi:hypothetical protein
MVATVLQAVRYNAYMNKRTGTLGCGEFYPVRARLYKEAKPGEELIN